MAEKGREIAVASEAVYNKGLEWYDHACWDEAAEEIRPSIQQYTCVLELKHCGSMYADYSLLARTMFVPASPVSSKAW